MKGKVAIVTGGSAGIGRATALAFAQKGAHVTIGDVAREAGEETVRMIKDQGGEAIFVLTDVSKDDDVKQMVERTKEAFGGLDYAFNNAGIEGVQKPTHEFSTSEWERVISINLTGTWRCMVYEIEAMLERGGGSIVNNASILGLVGFQYASGYVASKHAVIGLTKTAALEYATQGIRVNAICPGFVETAMLERGGVTTNQDVFQMLMAATPVRRLGQPEEIAAPVVWLCSDEASFITGMAMLADGGYVAQ
jgi:NAD(P)-dependent dehydrogenase (short-subunit alcohol dehydrogenase family)